MLLTIYNLPSSTRYQDIKTLLKAKCGLTELILDNLAAHTSNSKKVTVGLPEEEDAAIVVRKINGLYVDGFHLLVEPVKKKPANTSDNMYKNEVMSTFSAPSFNMGDRTQTNKQTTSGISNNPPALLRQPPALQQPYYQQASYNMNYQLGFGQNNVQQTTTPFSYGQSTNQNVFANYGYPQQLATQSPSQLMSQPFGSYKQEAPLGFGQQSSSNVWLTNQNSSNNSGNASAGNSFSQQRSTRWDDPDKNNSRSSRDARSDRDRERDRDRDRNTASNRFGRDQSSRGQARSNRRRSPLNLRDFDQKRHSQGGERDYRRDSRDYPRNDRFDRNNRNRASPIKQPPVINAPPKPSPWQSEIYGKHVTEPSFPLNPPKVPRPSRRRERNTNPKPPALQKFLKEKFEPLAKRARLEAKNKVNASDDKKKASKDNGEAIPNKAATWRNQLASFFARDIMSKNKTNVDKDMVLSELKSVIRNRLATLVGNDYEMRMDAMSALYKSHYTPKNDRELFVKVTGEIKKLKPSKPIVVNPAKPAVTPKPEDKQPIAETVKGEEDPEAATEASLVEESEPAPVNEDDADVSGGTETAENTEKYKSMMKDEEMIISQLEPNLAKAIDEELDAMREQVVEELNDEPTGKEEKYKSIHETIKTTTLSNLQQVIKVNMAKRILNVQPVVMRVFCAPKVISRGKLRPILEQYGVIDLVKTNSGYIGFCNTYDDLDRLCSMTIPVESSTITFKALHLTGKADKVKKGDIIRQRQEISDAFTNYAQQILENKQENPQDGVRQDDKDLLYDINDQSEDVNDGNMDEETEEWNDESTVPETTNPFEATENDTENKQTDNQNAEESTNVDQDNINDTIDEQEPVGEEENNQVDDSNDQILDSNDHLEHNNDQAQDSNDQVDENEQENEPSENIDTDANEPKTNENNVNIKTEKTQDTASSEENKHILQENVNTVSTVKEELNKSLEMAEESDGSVNGKGELDQAIQSEDIGMEHNYDDIDMADLDEDDLEDW